MKNILLVVLAVCTSLLLVLPFVGDATALTYLGAKLNACHYYQNHEMYGAAMHCFDKVLQNYPENIDALVGKASVLIELQEYGQSIPYLDKSLKIYPNNFYTIYDKAIALSGLGKYHEASSYYNQLLKMAPHFPLTEKDLKIMSYQFHDGISWR
jgi:tetratricopeptide (TPR) repeat protein